MGEQEVMIVVNFSHPLTEVQVAALSNLQSGPIDRVIDVRTQFDDQQPFLAQVQALVEATGLTQNEWQTAPLLLNLPAYAPVCATLLAYLHGIMGYFPRAIRLRPAPEDAQSRFEVAELMNLQAFRDEGRKARW